MVHSPLLSLSSPEPGRLMTEPGLAAAAAAARHLSFGGTVKTGAVGSGARGMYAARGGIRQAGGSRYLWSAIRPQPPPSPPPSPTFHCPTTDRDSAAAVAAGRGRGGRGQLLSGSISNTLAVGQARHRPAGNFGGQLLLLLGRHSRARLFSSAGRASITAVLSRSPWVAPKMQRWRVLAP